MTLHHRLRATLLLAALLTACAAGDLPPDAENNTNNTVNNTTNNNNVNGYGNSNSVSSTNPRCTLRRVFAESFLPAITCARTRA